MVRLSLPTRPHYRAGLFIGLALIFIGCAYATTRQFPEPTGRGLYTGYPIKLRVDYAKLETNVQQLLDLQSKQHKNVVSDEDLQSSLSSIQLDAGAGRYRTAEGKIVKLNGQLKNWQLAVLAPQATPTPPLVQVAAAATPSTDLFVPILIYHYPPPDLDAELDYLVQHHYTVVGLDAVVAAMTGGAALPAKPAVLTFDDGFENQMSAFSLLQKYQMKATFYIINGGEASHWCIGAGRRYGDPSQPPGGCGDAYLTWDQVRELDRSGLVTIGGHTLDHPQLATLSAGEQQHEIVDSKTEIEAEIGHPIYDFAYPYGSYNQTTIDIVRAAGYRTAVTTLAGDYQPAGSIYTLRRIRTTIGLP